MSDLEPVHKAYEQREESAAYHRGVLDGVIKVLTAFVLFAGSLWFFGPAIYGFLIGG